VLIDRESDISIVMDRESDISIINPVYLLFLFIAHTVMSCCLSIHSSLMMFSFKFNSQSML